MITRFMFFCKPGVTDSLSLKLPSMMWAIQKEIKDAYPKKVCHMLTRHDNKKKEKMHTQRMYATCPQGMSKKKKDSPHPKEIKEREMVHEKEFIHHPPKKIISPHTCTS